MNNQTVSPILLQAVGVTKAFGTAAPAVDDLTLSVRGGEVYCLLGGTGAGKTTVMRLLLGLVPPTTGRIVVNGEDVVTQPMVGRRHGTFISGAGSLCPLMTVQQNLALFAHLGRPTASWTSADQLNALRMMGIPERTFHTPLKGLRREILVAVWLAVAWLRDTPVVLLDEPTAGLDTRAVHQFQKHVWAFRERGRAVLMATADVLLASQVADRIGILKGGRMSAERTRAEVLSLSLSDLFLDYVGRPPGRAPVEPLRAPPRISS
jgi:ABC-2 type transport system ATP-binding protein